MAESTTEAPDAGEQAPGDSVTRLYVTLLGRPPSAEEHRSGSVDPASLGARLLASTEYRNRFRDAARTDENARAAVRLWPAAARPYDLHIVIASGEAWSKCERAIDTILPGMTERVTLTVLCGDHDAKPFPVHDGVEHVVFPGESVFQLRARLPSILKEAAWISLIEDHAVPLDGWLAGILAAIADQPDDCLAITGTAANLDSTAPWSWANFLFNFYRHWHPAEGGEVKGNVTTTLFRRDLVGVRPFRFCEFEEFLLGRPMPLFNSFPINHIQYTTLWEASVHVLDNGLVYGASIRRNSDRPRKALTESIGWVLGGRMREIAAVLAGHAKAAELPPGTVGRIRWIALCHSLGVVLGALFGGGRAHKRLE